MSWRVRAPGKLFVLGEYAVLDGAPAWVAAVDRGVQCDVTPGEGLETPADDRFARAALEAGGAHAGWRFVFSDWNPAGLAEKPGFGGSAAACVAGVTAACLTAGRSLAEVPALAAHVHREVQGSGSGMDVMASAHGGLRRHQRGRPPSAPLSLALPMLAVWSGRSAKTGPRVQRYLAWPEREAFARRGAELAETFAEAPIPTMREAYLSLRDMASAAGLEYDTGEHARIASLAERFGGAAKPSGAGGGDVAVALLPDPEAAARFAQACLSSGLPPIPVRIPEGVDVLELRHA